MNELFRRYDEATKKSVIKDKKLYSQRSPVYAAFTSLKDITAVYYKEEKVDIIIKKRIWIKGKWREGSGWGMGDKKGDFKFEESNYEYTGEVLIEEFIDMEVDDDRIVKAVAELLKKICGLTYGDYSAATDEFAKEKPELRDRPLDEASLIGKWTLEALESAYGYILAKDAPELASMFKIQLVFDKKNLYQMTFSEQTTKGTFNIDADKYLIVLTDSEAKEKIKVYALKGMMLKIIIAEGQKEEMTFFLKKAN